ncbi:hypothetical protein LSH36_420g02030 [Paralvinella palmiformis]|uniref:Luciferin 4-monooxygenase n=1 Tax=Paralvinella palmiformis TaxID=53620 RepID=A0AAD9JBJ0_9ANNE|nr:hypothetical protein LSH36_420g02030 [Paralvinella palmiformis]
MYSESEFIRPISWRLKRGHLLREKAFDKVNTEKRDIFCFFDLRRQQIRLVMADASLIQKSRLGLVDIPDDISFPDLILQRATEYGNRTALIDAQTDVTMTYAELRDNILRAASSLYERGLRKAEVTLIISNNHVLFPVACYAVTYLGGIASTVNPHYTTEELRYMVEDTSCSRIITQSPLINKVQRAVRGYTGLQEILLLDSKDGYTSLKELIDSGNPKFVSPVRINPVQDIAFLPYSSGTTGRSKGVMLSHYNLIANMYQDMHPSVVFGVHHPETFIVFLPFYHIYALSTIMSLGLIQGDILVVIEKYNLQLYMNCIYRYKATLLHMVPPVALQLAKANKSKNFMASVHTIFCGAAPLGPDVERSVLQRTGISTFRQGYGLTETSSTSHIAPVKHWKHGSCGLLLPNTECKVRDLETNEALGPNKDGEILLRGPQIMKGYWRRPISTANAIDAKGWFHTGDIGHYDEDGHFYIVDRLKELIKWKALQVPPAEIEEVLLKHPAVADVAVIGISDKEAGEVPRAYVVVKRGVKVTEKDIIDFVTARVAPHKKLRGGVQFIAEIPKSPSGKILRRILRGMMVEKQSYAAKL